jgi:FKBP-type peptidyl-prolyl cis-trans isomerase
MRLLTTALAVLPAFAYAQNLDITVTKPVECTRKTKNGDTVSMKYKGTLTDGTQFDSNFDSGRPFEFKLGAGQVIAGWDKGLLGMCIGEGRKLTIPPGMAYGSQRVGPIPAGSTLSEYHHCEREDAGLTSGSLRYGAPWDCRRES